jgi:hypothetical protein
MTEGFVVESPKQGTVNHAVYETLGRREQLRWTHSQRGVLVTTVGLGRRPNGAALPRAASSHM